MFVEEPLPPENADVLAEVRRATRYNRRWREMGDDLWGKGVCGEAAIDIRSATWLNCGGITEMKKIASAGGSTLHRHGAAQSERTLATAMNVQFAATIPNYLILETIGRSRNKS